jgi:hypothetical protein
VLRCFQFSAIEVAFGIASGLQEPTQYSEFGGGLPLRPSTTSTPPLWGAQVYFLRLLPNHHYKVTSYIPHCYNPFLAGF